jgi:hypothetical protein
MDKVKFEKLYSGVGWVTSVDDKYILLSYFLLTFRGTSDLPELIEMFELVAKGEKKFDEVWYPDVYLTFAENAGYIEIDKETAYFTSEQPEIQPSFDMPLKELLDIMKQWRDFLNAGAVV